MRRLLRGCLFFILMVITSSLIMERHVKTGNVYAEDKVFQKFVMDKNYFSCDIPANWKLDIDHDDEEKIYMIELLGPRAKKAPTVIYVSFYAKGNKEFADHKDFIECNSKNVLGETKTERETYSPVKTTLLNKKKAFYFERERWWYLHPETKSEESVLIKESLYVMPSRRGFYVLHYSASESLYQEFLPIFKRVVASFKTE